MSGSNGSTIHAQAELLGRLPQYLRVKMNKESKDSNIIPVREVSIILASARSFVMGKAASGFLNLM